LKTAIVKYSVDRRFNDGKFAHFGSVLVLRVVAMDFGNHSDRFDYLLQEDEKP
jgi:hypothetical protein